MKKWIDKTRLRKQLNSNKAGEFLLPHSVASGPRLSCLFYFREDKAMNKEAKIWQGLVNIVLAGKAEDVKHREKNITYSCLKRGNGVRLDKYIKKEVQNEEQQTA
jgi:hypothetical protein